jgi:hypothetical protein
VTGVQFEAGQCGGSLEPFISQVTKRLASMCGWSRSSPPSAGSRRAGVTVFPCGQRGTALSLAPAAAKRSASVGPPPAAPSEYWSLATCSLYGPGSVRRFAHHDSQTRRSASYTRSRPRKVSQVSGRAGRIACAKRQAQGVPTAEAIRPRPCRWPCRRCLSAPGGFS